MSEAAEGAPAAAPGDSGAADAPLNAGAHAAALENTAPPERGPRDPVAAKARASAALKSVRGGQAAADASNAQLNGNANQASALAGGQAASAPAAAPAPAGGEPSRQPGESASDHERRLEER